MGKAHYNPRQKKKQLDEPVLCADEKGCMVATFVSSVRERAKKDPVNYVEATYLTG
jgi:hypothetical protein